ncbi:MAG: EamA family transporter [Candidatus Roizmanbacteria bacterium]|nr:EamA family transporter [Candidatus Roizmanbacteria bacterium]
MILSTRMKAILALIVTGTIGGIAPLFMKIALREFSSYQVLFIRFGLAFLFVSPLLVKNIKKLTIKNLAYIIPAGLLFSGNVFFFVVGVQYTTSIVSQLFYLLTPVIVTVVGFLLYREKISVQRMVSMLVCFGGSSLLISRSMQGGSLIHSIGTFQGNILIICAVFSWALYAIYTKRLSKKFEPSLFLVTNFMTALLISCVSFFITKTSITSTVMQFIHSSFPVMGSLLALAIINSVIFFFLYQWSLKHVSAFIASLTTYLSPLSAALFAIPFFGEQLSVILIISAVSIFAGSYLILSEKR